MDTGLIDESYLLTAEGAGCILGANDRNLKYLESLLGTELRVRGTSIGTITPSSSFLPLMRRLDKLQAERGELSEAEIFMEWQALSQPAPFDKSNPVIKAGGKLVYPKSREQARFFRALASSDVVFAIGPAGTGKTFISMLWALSKVLSGEKRKILLARPVVEAGESLGFLPGDLQQKLDPYLRPMYDALEYVLSPQQLKRLEEHGTLEAAPLAYMRGRSVNDAVMILDEAQNAKAGQMKMFLTRLGANSQAIVTGDPSQVDLDSRCPSGLLDSIATLSGIEGISVVKFTHADTVRSRIVRDIVKAYDKAGLRDDE